MLVHKGVTQKVWLIDGCYLSSLSGILKDITYIFSFGIYVIGLMIEFPCIVIPLITKVKSLQSWDHVWVNYVLGQ